MHTYFFRCFDIFLLVENKKKKREKNVRFINIYQRRLMVVTVCVVNVSVLHCHQNERRTHEEHLRELYLRGFISE